MNRLCRMVPWLLVALVPIALAQGAAPGEKWHVTVTMQAAGLSLPARTVDVCTNPADRNSVPVSSDRNCQVYDVTRSGNTQSFKMRCTGRQQMDGSGEITYSGDHYQGRFNAATGGTSVAMTYEGQKLGSCDGSEVNDAKKIDAVKQQIAAQQASAQKAQQQGCLASAENATSPYQFMDAYHTGVVPCTDPVARQTYCAHFQTYKPFLEQARSQTQSGSGQPLPGTTPLTDSAALCGLQLQAVRQKLCAGAEGAGQTDFLVSQCPAEMKAVVQRECAGRNYTSTSPQYRSFCAQYALDAVGGGQTTAPQTQNQNQNPDSSSSATDKAKDAIQKGKNALKGLFGR